MQETTLSRHASGRGDVTMPALVSPAWPPHALANGVVTYVGHLAPAMRELGVQPRIIAACLDARDPQPQTDEYVCAAPASRPALWRRAWGRLAPQARASRIYLDQQGRALADAAARLAAGHRIDLVEMEESFGWALQMMAAARVPVVVRLHGPWFLNGPAQNVHPDPLAAWRIAQEGLAIARCDGLTAPSRDVLHRVRERYHLDLPHAMVIANPMPAAPMHQRWDARRCEAGRICFVGRFDRHKGGDLMLEAFAQIARRRGDAVLAFAGLDRRFEDAAGRSWTLNQYLRERFEPELRRRVQVLGQCSAEELNEQRRRAAVTLVPSRYESFGLTLTEAMALGCPVVATAVGALPEIVQNGRNGLLARPEDTTDLARAIETMLSSIELAAALGEAAAEDCARRYSPRCIAQQTLAYYGEVAARRLSASPSAPQSAPAATPAPVASHAS